MDEMRRRMMMRNRQSLDLDELKVKDGAVIKEISKEELEFVLEKTTEDLKNSKAEITNHENAIKETNEKIKNLEEKEEKLKELIKGLK